MKQLLLICAVVVLVGCGEAAKEKAAKIKAAADARAAAEKKATEMATIPQ
jgi:siroheme synthase (precorrin-2 oxidase/ferrochelatase)